MKHEAEDQKERREQLRDIVTKRVTEEIAPHMALVLENIDRVMNLVGIYLSESEAKPDTHYEDILRSAVVLMHATLEDVLRTIGMGILPRADEKTLNDVPLKGVNPASRPEKFFLGRLREYRGKTSTRS